jgi:transcriptional regulator with XRE-family HTH domain
MEAVGAKPADVGRLLGISVQKIGNWTRGDNYPDEYLLTVFCDRYGVTMDYLYRGVLRGLDGTLADGLASARAASGQALMAAAPPAREPKRKATKA